MTVVAKLTRKIQREGKHRAIIIYINGPTDGQQESDPVKICIYFFSLLLPFFFIKTSIPHGVSVSLVDHKPPWINPAARDADARSSCSSLTRLKYRSNNLMLHRSLILHPSINALRWRAGSTLGLASCFPDSFNIAVIRWPNLERQYP